MRLFFFTASQCQLAFPPHGGSSVLGPELGACLSLPQKHKHTRGEVRRRKPEGTKWATPVGAWGGSAGVATASTFIGRFPRPPLSLQRELGSTPPSLLPPSVGYITGVPPSECRGPTLRVYLTHTLDVCFAPNNVTSSYLEDYLCAAKSEYVSTSKV